MKLIKLSILILLIFNLSSVRGQIIDSLCAPAIGVYGVSGNQGSQFFWQVKGGTIISGDPTLDSIVVDWDDAEGLYELSVIETTSDGCSGDTISAFVMVFVPSLVSITGPDSICFGDEATLIADITGKASSWQWNTGDTSKILNVQPPVTTTYSMVVENFCGNDTAEHTIKVNPLPDPDFDFLPHIPEIYENVQFTYTGTPAVTYNWYSMDQGYFSMQQNPFISYNDPQTDKVILEVTNEYGCTDTVQKSIPVIANPILYVPNAFTPDGDGLNDEFLAVGRHISNYHFLIYDKWGNLLFESFNIYDGWDGTFKGDLCMTDVYAYVIYYNGIGDHEKLDRVKKGTVTLIR